MHVPDKSGEDGASDRASLSIPPILVYFCRKLHGHLFFTPLFFRSEQIDGQAHSTLEMELGGGKGRQKETTKKLVPAATIGGCYPMAAFLGRYYQNLENVGFIRN